MMMKKHFVWLLPTLVLLLVSSVTGRADQFTDIQNSPYTYWVPAPSYVGAPPPPYYYGPPPGPVVIVPPPPPVRFFFGFHFH
jgi:hypothetical protein